MSPDQLIYGLFDLASEHIKPPAGYEWLPAAAMGAVAFFGLLMCLRGARWAPALSGVALAGVGAAGGLALSDSIGTPALATAIVAAALSAAIGVVLFRFWQALLLAVCCVAIGYGIYFARTLTPEVDNWLAATSDPQQLVTLEPAGSVVGAQQSFRWDDLRSLGRHLEAHVPGFARTSWSIVLGAGLAGLVFGLLLPRLSRSLWAATIGTLLLGVGTAALLNQYRPDALEWLLADDKRAWAIVAGVWALAVILNLASSGKRKARPSRDAEGQSQPATA